MVELWLKPNRRAILFGCLPPIVIIAIGAWLAFRQTAFAGELARAAGYLLIALGITIIILLLWQLRRPRIAYRNGHLLFYLRAARPIAIPVDVVEAFFVGQGPARLPGAAGREQTINLIARISQRSTDWAARPVNPALGSWCDGYVTIRGTWCEPLRQDLIRHLNRRLKEVKSLVDIDAAKQST